MYADNDNPAPTRKFADMAPGAIKRWVAFARSHDWGQNAYYDQRSGRIMRCVSYDYARHPRDGHEILRKVCEQFDNPRDMRNWAGY